MKLADLRNPVRFDWLTDQGFRLDANPYLSGAYEARKLLERLLGTRPLRELTVGHDGGIFNGPKFSRLYTNDPEYGVPFMGSTDMLEADFTNLPLLHRKTADQFPYLEVKPGMTMITCSGTVGRTAYVRPDMAGFWSSQHTMKVNPDHGRVLPGYLYAFLQSRYGIPIVVGAAYGAIVQHIEPHQIATLPVPRLGRSLEEEIHERVQAAADLRVRFQAGVTAATRDLFESAGLPELIDYRWYREPRAIGFEVDRISAVSLRAMNYDARPRKLARAISSVPHRTLGEICEGGELSRGNRFTRIPAEPGHGHLLVGQEQVFWTRPVGRWVAVKEKEVDVLRARDETIVAASQGLLTEGSLIGRSAFITGSWLEYIYSEHLLRVRSGAADFPNAYLFAFMRSEATFRMMRSLVAGTGPQDINAVLRREIPVPECTPADRERIAETVRQAYRWRDEADQHENKAQELLDAAVRNAARADLRQDGDLTYKPREAHGTGDG
jgi:type I restriction enzyme S subunit